MQLKRCAILFIELRESARFSLDSLMQGGDGLARHLSRVALAPHLEHEVEVTTSQCALLESLSPSRYVEASTVKLNCAAADIAYLLEQGLVLAEDSEITFRRSNEMVREMNWWPLAAVFHRFARWQGVDGVEPMERHGLQTSEGLCQQFGQPPAADAEHLAPHQRQLLPRLSSDTFDALLERRTTCRNFDATRALPLQTFARMLGRVFGAQHEIHSGGATFLKKSSPSAGGLHPTSAYLFIQHVDGIDRGLYHYHAATHALEPLDTDLDGCSLRALALKCLAQQHWFADAHVIVAFVPRFARTYWKYRKHSKAYRAVTLDVGHLSQTLYLSATDLRLGAFVTSAINDIDIDRAFGLDGMSGGAIALGGFGYRSERMQTVELDPGAAVWKRDEEAPH